MCEAGSSGALGLIERRPVAGISLETSDACPAKFFARMDELPFPSVSYMGKYYSTRLLEFSSGLGFWPATVT
jgi:hypothetical protein